MDALAGRGARRNPSVGGGAWNGHLRTGDVLGGECSGQERISAESARRQRGPGKSICVLETYCGVDALPGGRSRLNPIVGSGGQVRASAYWTRTEDWTIWPGWACKRLQEWKQDDLRSHAERALYGIRCTWAARCGHSVRLCCRAEASVCVPWRRTEERLLGRRRNSAKSKRRRRSLGRASAYWRRTKEWTLWPAAELGGIRA